MRSTTLRRNFALVSALLVGLAAACTSGNAEPPVAAVDGGVDALPGEGTRQDTTLTVSLDPSIDVASDEDEVKATVLTSADLLDTAGRTVARATIADGRAVFGMTGIVAGDYFLKINDDGDDLVPTRLDDPATDVAQRIGQKLRASSVGPIESPSYRINTWSAGQKKNPVVKFSDGTSISGEQPYVILTLAVPKVEFKVLGSAAPLSTFTPRPVHAGDKPFDSWVLNTTGMDHHGDTFLEDGGPSACSSCHWEDWRKPLGGYNEMRPSQSWCSACHNGMDGSGAGFVDPAK